jgi:hypothetical protein
MRITWCVLLLGGCLAGPTGCLSIKKMMDFPMTSKSRTSEATEMEVETEKVSSRSSRNEVRPVPAPITKLLPNEITSENAPEKAEVLRQELSREIRSVDSERGTASRNRE